MIMVNVAFISERFWLVPACEPSTLLAAFLERFQSACLLAQQLPAMKPEQLKSMVKLQKGFSLFRILTSVLFEALYILFTLENTLKRMHYWDYRNSCLSHSFTYTYWPLFPCSLWQRTLSAVCCRWLRKNKKEWERLLALSLYLSRWQHVLFLSAVGQQGEM